MMTLPCIVTVSATSSVIVTDENEYLLLLGSGLVIIDVKASNIRDCFSMISEPD